MFGNKISDKNLKKAYKRELKSRSNIVHWEFGGKDKILRLKNVFNELHPQVSGFLKTSDQHLIGKSEKLIIDLENWLEKKNIDSRQTILLWDRKVARLYTYERLVKVYVELKIIYNEVHHELPYLDVFSGLRTIEEEMILFYFKEIYQSLVIMARKDLIMKYSSKLFNVAHLIAKTKSDKLSDMYRLDYYKVKKTELKPKLIRLIKRTIEDYEKHRREYFQFRKVNDAGFECVEENYKKTLNVYRKSKEDEMHVVLTFIHYLNFVLSIAKFSNSIAMHKRDSVDR